MLRRICKNEFLLKNKTAFKNFWNDTSNELIFPVTQFRPVSSRILPSIFEFPIKNDTFNAFYSNNSRSRLLLPVECPNIHSRNFLTFPDGEEEKDSSRHHEERRILGYSKEQLYSVVAGVDMYQDFVPWCQKSSIIWRKGNKMEAELQIGFKLFKESYTSYVELNPPYLVKTTVSKSILFDYLNNLWEFSDGPYPNSCNLHFKVDFQFRSTLYRQVADLFFAEVVGKLVSSFEKRCLFIYGPSSIRHLVKENV